jgi:hypothetical protein
MRELPKVKDSLIKGHNFVQGSASRAAGSARDERSDMKRLLAGGLAAALLAIGAATASAASNPSGTGQPSQTCLSSTAPSEPGHAAAASGSAFNETAPGTAGVVYAGNGISATIAGSGNAVSQYDVACFQVSQTH